MSDRCSPAVKLTAWPLPGSKRWKRGHGVVNGFGQHGKHRVALEGHERPKGRNGVQGVWSPTSGPVGSEFWALRSMIRTSGRPGVAMQLEAARAGLAQVLHARARAPRAARPPPRVLLSVQGRSQGERPFTAVQRMWSHHRSQEML